ncbi:MAG: hypothetical protein KDB14_34065 [Planctomycetales bacterium]|nr:hypothetical protein [Planctomycetales bacterium]
MSQHGSRPRTGRRLAASLAVLIALGAATASATDLSGTWTGEWRSCVTGHHGPLRAKFCRVDACHYQVTFCGRFAKLVPFRYAVTLRIVQDGDTVVLAGSQKLGRLMGDYHYRATANGCVFHSNYCSKKDHGYFHLERR